eukprot:TRINITY_DN10360_c0_g1_i1.p1 TRINITY_DN10360_c0_g1~~TRINITY_DN10360_c0_g1_i1.p1  ORF type:complete len:130 (+),score=20.71 TRINITY_DN10360_c0_g1_i1:16-405(+)
MHQQHQICVQKCINYKKRTFGTAFSENCPVTPDTTNSPSTGPQDTENVYNDVVTQQTNCLLTPSPPQHHQGGVTGSATLLTSQQTPPKRRTNAPKRTVKQTLQQGSPRARRMFLSALMNREGTDMKNAR